MQRSQASKKSPSKLPRTLSSILPGSGIKKIRKVAATVTPPVVKTRRRTSITALSQSVQNTKSLATCLNAAQKILDDLKASAPADEPQPARENYQQKLDRLAKFSDESVTSILAEHLEEYQRAIAEAKPCADTPSLVLQLQYDLFGRIKVLADLCEIKAADIIKNAPGTAAGPVAATTAATTRLESGQPGDPISPIGSGAVSQTTSHTAGSHQVGTIERQESSMPTLASRKEFAASTFTRLANDLIAARRALTEATDIVPKILEKVFFSADTGLALLLSSTETGAAVRYTENMIAQLRIAAAELRGDPVASNVSHQQADYETTTSESASELPLYSESDPASATAISATQVSQAFSTFRSLPFGSQDSLNGLSNERICIDERGTSPSTAIEISGAQQFPEFPHLDSIFSQPTSLSGKGFSSVAADSAEGNKTLSGLPPSREATPSRKRRQLFETSRSDDAKSPKRQATDLPGGTSNT